MSVSGMTMRKSNLETWGNPEAPPDYGKGRTCSSVKAACQTYQQLFAVGLPPEVGKVTRYSESHGEDENGNIVILCEPCERFRVKNDLTAFELVGVRKKSKSSAYPLPNLRTQREKAKYSTTRLAAAAGCLRQTINKIENENFNPRIKANCELARCFAEILGVDVRTLRGEWGNG